MPNPVKVSVVVADVELIETVLQRSSVEGEITVSVQPSSSQRVPVNNTGSEPGAARFKIIQGL